MDCVVFHWKDAPAPLACKVCLDAKKTGKAGDGAWMGGGRRSENWVKTQEIWEVPGASGGFFLESSEVTLGDFGRNFRWNLGF